MNVYAYGGPDRRSATTAVTPGNEPLKVGEEYWFASDKGILLIAYPNQDKVTDFSFDYWVAPAS